MLRVEDICVQFGGVRALDSVQLSAEAGVVTGLIGPNGAGKTTLFNVVTGLQRPTTGRILFGQNDVTRKGPRARAALELGRTFQRPEIFGSLTARDNVLVALEARRRVRGGYQHRRARADELLERVGITRYADHHADLLSTGLVRLLEVARALATEPRLLLLDEVSAGLDVAESERLGDLLLEIARSGVAVVLVEHDIDLVMRVCSQIFVLDFGTVIASGAPREIQSDPNVQAAYLGSDGVPAIVPMSEEPS